MQNEDGRVELACKMMQALQEGLHLPENPAIAEFSCYFEAQVV